MTGTVVAYIPVLHEGYRRLLESHARGGRCFVPDRTLYADYRPLAKDIRALDPEWVVSALRGWDVCEQVALLDDAAARALAEERGAIVLPAEDVSYQLVDRYFARSAVSFDATFLRWDKTKTAQLMRPKPSRTIDADELVRELYVLGEDVACLSVDWWRQVGAALRFADGAVVAACNTHAPHELSAYAVGDPRSNFYRGVHLELSTATHAEAQLIADAARSGRSTAGGSLYVTDFPCPPCARLIAGAGLTTLYYSDGYAVLDGQEILCEADVDVVRVQPRIHPDES